MNLRVMHIADQSTSNLLLVSALQMHIQYCESLAKDIESGMSLGTCVQTTLTATRKAPFDVEPEHLTC